MKYAYVDYFVKSIMLHPPVPHSLLQPRQDRVLYYMLCYLWGSLPGGVHEGRHSVLILQFHIHYFNLGKLGCCIIYLSLIHI